MLKQKTNLEKPRLPLIKNVLSRLRNLQLCLLFFLKTMKLYSICSACFGISRTSAEIFFLADWRPKRLKKQNRYCYFTENPYGFSKSEMINVARSPWLME